MGPTNTLLQASVNTGSALRQVLWVLSGTLLIAICAQISVPIGPVPISMQTFAVLLVGFTFGSRLGAATLATYLAQGAIGLPVFANGGSAAALIGPTAGFLYGFVAMAWAAGFAAERGIARGIVPTALVGAALSLLLYIPGLAWPMTLVSLLSLGMEGDWIGQGLGSYYWPRFMQPFLVGDMLKAILVAMSIALGWKMLERFGTR